MTPLVDDHLCILHYIISSMSQSDFQFQVVNKYTVATAIACSWLIPAIAAVTAATKSFEHNEMCIPSHSETKIGVFLGKENIFTVT